MLPSYSNSFPFNRLIGEFLSIQEHLAIQTNSHHANASKAACNTQYF